MLDPLMPLAPLHQPNNLAPIRPSSSDCRSILQVACFDTAFHRGHPEVADRFAIPEPFYREGVRRYGFHGLVLRVHRRSTDGRAPEIANGKVVVAHLGSGASMCALSGGRSIDSTMGFTALDGLPMGTRPGQLDAGIVLYLSASEGHDRDADRAISSTTTAASRAFRASATTSASSCDSDDPRAGSLGFLRHRIAVLAGSLGAAMEGIDGFVFTAGVGENAPAIRSAVVKRLAWLGVELDDACEQEGRPVISTRASRIACLVVPTDEELMIARHTRDCLRG